MKPEFSFCTRGATATSAFPISDISDLGRGALLNKGRETWDRPVRREGRAE
jgi:hypothetical protein